MTRPMDNPPARVRQRQRASGAWRIWWEPETAVRKLGFASVELDAKRLTWSTREATRLNGLVQRARASVAPTIAQASGARTMSALISAFMASPGWARLKPDAQRDYRGGFRIIEQKWGDWQVQLCGRGVVVEWSETLARDRGEWQAKSVIRKLSLLMSYAERREWIETNPCLRLRIPTPPPRARVVAWEEFDALVEVAHMLGLGGMVLAISMGWWTGQRRRDVIMATTGQIGTDRVWRFRRSKAQAGSAQAAGAIAIHPELWPLIAARLDAAATTDAPICWDAATRAAISDDLFGKRFAAVRAAAVAAGAASCADIQFRDLRRSWAHWSREGGASDRDRADGMGNQSDSNARLSQTYNPPTMAGAARAVDAIQRPAARLRRTACPE